MRTWPLFSKYFDTDSKQRFTSDSSPPTNPPEWVCQIFPLALIQYPARPANRAGNSDFLRVLQPYASRGDGALGNFGKENNLSSFSSLLSFVCSLANTSWRGGRGYRRLLSLSVR